MRPYCRAGVCSRHMSSIYGLVHRNNSTAGINCVRPPTIPPSSSLKLEATSLAKQRRLFRQI